MTFELYFEDCVRVVCSATRTKHAELFSAFEYGEVLTYRMYLAPELMVNEATLSLFRDDDGATLTIPGQKEGDGFTFTVESDQICLSGRNGGLFYYCFHLDNKVLSQNEFGEGYYLSDTEEGCSKFQLSVYRPGSNRQLGYEGGIMYQIFPDRFFRSENRFTKDGAVIEEDWYGDIREYPLTPGAPVKNNHFFGGDLYGIAEKLDYLKELGVTLIYLNPIFKAASNHRYDTGDYEQVDELLGGNAALQFLIDRAKEKGIGIILDGVFNHTGDDSKYFNKYGRYPTLGAYQSKDSPYYDWYFFKNYPDSYECWWGITIQPKMNGKNEKYLAYFAGEDGIISRYLKMGIAGWRLDVADELPDEALDAIKSAAEHVDGKGLVYGEVWEDASNKISYSVRRHYFTGGQLTATMNYPLKNAIVGYLTEGDAEFIFYTMKTIYSHYPKSASDLAMNILSTHDTERILTVLAGSPQTAASPDILAHAVLTAEERASAIKKIKIAALLQMTLPGIPCIYYGDEIGMEGYHDPFNRKPYPWGREDEQILSYYKTLTSFRKQCKMLADAYYRGISAKNGVYIFERFNDKGEILKVIANLSDHCYLERFQGKMLLCPAMTEITDGIAVAQNTAVALYRK